MFSQSLNGHVEEQNDSWVLQRLKVLANHFVCCVLVNSLPNSIKRAFVISSMYSRMKMLDQSQNSEIFVKLNQLFCLTDGAASLEFPTKYLAKKIWLDEDIELMRQYVKQPDSDLRQLSIEVADHLPKWVMYSSAKNLPRMEIEHLLRLQRKQIL
jgi:hypothetical protein